MRLGQCLISYSDDEYKDKDKYTDKDKYNKATSDIPVIVIKPRCIKKTIHRRSFQNWHQPRAINNITIGRKWMTIPHLFVRQPMNVLILIRYLIRQEKSELPPNNRHARRPTSTLSTATDPRTWMVAIWKKNSHKHPLCFFIWCLVFAELWGCGPANLQVL